jgi:hypothetical protein
VTSAEHRLNVRTVDAIAGYCRKRNISPAICPSGDSAFFDETFRRELRQKSIEIPRVSFSVILVNELYELQEL